MIDRNRSIDSGTTIARGVILIAIALGGLPAMAATIYVPADRATIQGAISDPNTVLGDEILVSPGTYLENIDFLGKSITVESAQGPDVTIIEGIDINAVVQFINDEGLGSVLTGFTITSSFQQNGILCASASPLIKGNIIEELHSGILAFGEPLILQ